MSVSEWSNLKFFIEQETRLKAYRPRPRRYDAQTTRAPGGRGGVEGKWEGVVKSWDLGAVDRQTWLVIRAPLHL